MKRFKDRIDAGRQLATALLARNFPDPVVLALPRGGVPVAVEVAAALKAPLDLIMVRKLGVPSQPELAAGAVVNGDRPEIVVNEIIAAHFGLDAQDMQALADGQLPEIRRRRALYLAGRPSVTLTGRTAIVVDDGIATGATMRAALCAVRRQSPARIIVAVPVAASESLISLGAEADEIICLSHPGAFIAVGAHYDAFPQISDDEVVHMLNAVL
jgi:putative phosphoribosyl transferase